MGRVALCPGRRAPWARKVGLMDYIPLLGIVDPSCRMKPGCGK